MPATPQLGNPTAANPSQYVSHAGDTLDSVAKRYSVSVESLRAANKGINGITDDKNSDDLPLGIVLAIPLPKDRFNAPVAAKVSGVGASAAEPGADPTADLPTYRRTNPWSPDANWTQTSSNNPAPGSSRAKRSPGSSGGASGGSFNVSATALKGNSNAQRAFNYFVGKGLSPAQAAGIVGNLMQESGCNPEISQIGGGPGRGIAQWSVGERWRGVEAQARAEGKSTGDLGVQLDYLWKEMNSTEKGSLSAVKGASSAADAAVAFERSFERAGQPNNTSRIKFAREAQAEFGNA